MTDRHLPPRPVMGIGACLAGKPVRYNGQTNTPNDPVRHLTETFEMRSFCPEMGIGMGVPRPPIQLVGTSGDVRALDVESHSRDYTEQLAGYARTVLKLTPRLCGYILVKGSPSCGYDLVKRYADNGHHIASDQQGIFAAALGRADPLLPLEDDSRLSDPGLRESFVTRAYAYHDWKQLCTSGLSKDRLIGFYSRYKHLVMAHHLPAYQQLEGMLTNAGKRPLEELTKAFIGEFMACLSQHPTSANRGLPS